jgi:membrane associated rhomboid family serine protease
VRDRRIGVVLIVWALYTIVQGMLTPYVDNGAHLGGLLGGMLLARRVHPVVIEPPAPEVQARIKRRGWATLLVLVAAGLGWLFR